MQPVVHGMGQVVVSSFRTKNIIKAIDFVAFIESSPCVEHMLRSRKQGYEVFESVAEDFCTLVLNLLVAEPEMVACLGKTSDLCLRVRLKPQKS